MTGLIEDKAYLNLAPLADNACATELHLQLPLLVRVAKALLEVVVDASHTCAAADIGSIKLLLGLHSLRASSRLRS